MEDGVKLTEYLNGAVQRVIKNAVKNSSNNPAETVFLVRFSAASRKAASRRVENEKAGFHIPPFLIASITSGCNLFCSGCFARLNGLRCGQNEKTELSSSDWSRIFSEAKGLGISFILLAGGEPLLRKEIIECAAEFPQIVFPVFTNGTLFDGEYISLFDGKRNLIPVLSLEGFKEQTDERRGEGTYDKVLEAMGRLRDKRIFYGASVTVTTANIKTVTDSLFINGLRSMGCGLVFFVEYVAVEKESEFLALSENERAFLEEKLENLRAFVKDVIFLSFPGDEKRMGGCLAAGRGFFHINSGGRAEPCPFSPFSDISVLEDGLEEALKSALFSRLKDSGMLLEHGNGGCALAGKESEIKKLL